MNTMLFQIPLLLLVLIVANIAYKGRTFDSTSWNRVLALSLWFIICALLLLGVNSQKLIIITNFTTVSIFIITTLVWFLFPKLIRLYGTYPSSYLKDKKGNTRFMVRFESPSMTIKYFEVLFQQATFVFLLFLVLEGLSTIASVFLFTLIVAIIHLGNLFFLPHKWALFYSALSIPMAILFGYIILQGFVLFTVTMHLTFYLVFNARYWFLGELNKH